MTRNSAVAICAFILLVVSILFEAGGPLPAVAEAAKPAERGSKQKQSSRIMGSFGAESDRFEDPAEPEPDEGLSEDRTVSPEVEAYGVVESLSTVPAPLRGTIINVARVE